MKLYCKVSRERVYRGQLPLHLVIGVNIIRRDLRVQWLRPAPAPPLVLALHSRTSVAAGRGGAGCGPVTVVSRGEEARSRVILDTEAALAGSRARAEIVDCEMEEVRGLQVTHCSLHTQLSHVLMLQPLLHAARIFSPWSKQPASPGSLLLGGLGQLLGDLLHLARPERCGGYLSLAASSQQPVREVDISLQARRTTDISERQLLGEVGQKTFLRVEAAARGDTALDTRNMKLNLKLARSALGLRNLVRLQLGWTRPGPGQGDYLVCASLDTQYPGPGPSLLHTDLATSLALRGAAAFRYGAGTRCGDTAGRTEISFRHATTEQARQQLRGSREYRRCEAQRASSEWSRSAGTPHTRACHLAAWDAGLARNYTWHVDWSATTPPVRRWVDRAQTLAKARASNESPNGDSSRKRPLLGRSW